MNYRPYTNNSILIIIVSVIYIVLISLYIIESHFGVYIINQIELNLIGLYKEVTLKGNFLKEFILGSISLSNTILSLIDTFSQPYIYILLIASYYVFLSIISIVSLKNWSLQKQFEKKIIKLEDKVSHLAKSRDFSIKLQKEILHLSKNKSIPEYDIKPIKGCKKRILAYTRNELVPISMQDISCVYVENQTTYILRKDGIRSITNLTLSDIYNCLDKSFFFKVNRQIIISISSIKKILKIDESKLKIEITPILEMDILIGKNKVAQFKKWLDI